MKTPIQKSVADIAHIVKAMIRRDGSDASGAVRDLMTDLRHFCEAKGLDFHERADASYQVYLEEKQAARSEINARRNRKYGDASSRHTRSRINRPAQERLRPAGGNGRK